MEGRESNEVDCTAGETWKFVSLSILPVFLVDGLHLLWTEIEWSWG